MRLQQCAKHGQVCPDQIWRWVDWMRSPTPGKVITVHMRPGECMTDAINRGSFTQGGL